jgi:ElaB/YqjD/DUF883 family membrane-anchored ribosome-binding protein
MANPTTSPKGKEENRTGSTQPLEKARENAGQAVDKAKGAASAVGEMVGNAASAVGQSVSHAASSVGQGVSSAASAVGHKAEDLTSSAGAGIRHLGETLQQKAPHEGMLGNASQAVASTVTNTGRYIEEAGLSGMMDDLTEVIRRNPLPAVLVGVGVGVLIGRLLRS